MKLGELRKFIRELIEEEEDLEEMSTTGNVAGYQTPHAFSTKDKPDDDYIDRLNKSTGYTRVNESQVSKAESSDLKNIISYFEKKHPEFDPWYDGMGTVTLSLDWDVNYFINIEGKIDFDIMFFDEVKNKRKSLGNGLDYRKVIKVIERFISRPEIKKVIGENTSPKNWKKLTKDKEDEQEYKNRWLELKNSDGTPNQKIGVGIRKIRRELVEMEKFVNWYSRIRSMNELDKDDYWKRTQSHLKKIKERLIGFAQKIQELDRPISELTESTIISERKVTSISGFNLESDVFISMLEHFKNDSNFKRIVSKYSIDLLTGGNPKNIVTTMTNEFNKLFTRGNVIQTIADKVNKRSLRIDVSGRDKSKLSDTFAKVLAYGVMWELAEDPSHLAKIIGDTKLEKVAKEFQIRRGKVKFTTMMQNKIN